VSIEHQQEPGGNNVRDFVIREVEIGDGCLLGVIIWNRFETVADERSVRPDTSHDVAVMLVDEIRDNPLRYDLPTEKCRSGEGLHVRSQYATLTLAGNRTSVGRKKCWRFTSEADHLF